MPLNTKNIQDIKKIINTHKVLVFIKGSHHQPACGFSAKTLKILNQYNISFQTINVLENSIIRKNIKIYSNWPTIPQIYINGEFIGGFDLLNKLHEKSELQELLEKTFGY